MPVPEDNLPLAVPEPAVTEPAVTELDVTDPAVLADQAAALGRARERRAVARLLIPGMPMWVVLRHAEVRRLLTDPRLELDERTYQPLDVADELRPYLRNMSSAPPAEHARLRRLVAPAFTARRAAELRPRIERTVHRLLDDVAAAGPGPVDLLPLLARPLPMATMCELVGVPEADRPRWLAYGELLAAGHGQDFTRIIAPFVADARAAVAAARDRPDDDPSSDLLGDLVRIHDEDGDRLSEPELVALVWQLVLAGQTAINLVANAVAELLRHPDQLAGLRADPAGMPAAVEELIRWCGPQLLTFPRFPREDLVVDGVRIPAGEPVTCSLLAADRDPRVFADPERFDLRRTAGADGRPLGGTGHLAFAHGPHFCLGAAVARVQLEVVVGALLDRFPALAVADPDGLPDYLPDPATWRLPALRVTL